MKKKLYGYECPRCKNLIPSWRGKCPHCGFIFSEIQSKIGDFVKGGKHG